MKEIHDNRISRDKNRVFPLSVVLLAALTLLSACQDGDPSTCAPYGSIAPTAPAHMIDPPLGASPTPTQAASPTPPPPTCTPPWPTWTPRPAPAYARAPIEIATAPQNLTFSPGSEALGDVALSSRAIAATWRRGDESYLSVRTALGWRTLSAPPGVGGELAVAISPIGRTHVLGANGAYAYSDDDGQTWSSPVPATPAGHAPRLHLQPDGFVRAFTLADGTLYTAQQKVERWSPPQAFAGGVRSYDVTLYRDGASDEGRDLVAVAGDGGARLYRDDELLASWPAAGITFISVTARDGHTVVGMGWDYQAAVAWQNEAGGDWRICTLQEITVPEWTSAGKAKIGQVYGVAAWRQEQIVALWTWSQPGHENRGDFFYIVISHTRDDACDPYPALHDAQNLYPQFGGPPGLFATLSPQAAFRLALRGERGMVAFAGLQWNGRRDIYVAEFHPDTILSAGYAEEGP